MPFTPASFNFGSRPKSMSGWTLITRAMSAAGISVGRSGSTSSIKSPNVVGSGISTRDTIFAA
jgi:hypothetical protein